MRWAGFGFVVVLAWVGGCTNRVTSASGGGSSADADGTDATGQDSESGPGTTGIDTDGTGGDPDQTVFITTNKDIDILFVIDNSGSMQEVQRNFVASAAQLVSILEADGLEANYRIGFTTTDNGNPWCSDTGPEGGRLVLSSCLDRLQDFIFEGPGVDPGIDICTESCSEATHAALTAGADAYPTQPTTTASDPMARPRPWIEWTAGVSNLPDGIDTTAALQCLAPQGINGCGFESHLESMYKALTRSNRDDEDSFGFVRDNAVLAVVFLTDEADCSYNNNQQSIFLPDGLRTFWSLPNADSPTSAVCWNAGVRCEGSGTYSSCSAVDLDVAGNEVSPAAAEDQAVLRPVSRYTALLQEIEDLKQMLTPGQEVIVSAITGVPMGYPSADIVYQDAPGGTANDPNYQVNFGIGPGCTSTVAEAVPPVRLREVAEFFATGSGPQLFSVCDTDYAPALSAIATALTSQIAPACMPACVADTDPTTPLLDPNCVLTQSEPQPDGTRIDSNIPPCNADGSLPPDTDVCFVALVDSGFPGRTTPELDDDLSPACRDEGWNLEFIFHRREGVGVPGGTQIQANCQLSQNRAIDCPGLP